jgi:DNA modification methylase
MTPHFADDWLTVYLGDCRAVLASFPAESVHCVVTSPPYWGLRDYGTASWTGGEEACDHAMPVSYKSSTLGASSGGRSVETHQRNIEAQAAPYSKTCRKCGALRVDGQLGLEATPEAYVEAMVGVFREVRRVLRADGTLWLNMGDSYASSPPGTSAGGFSASSGLAGAGSARYKATMDAGAGTKRNTITPGLKPKDLVGIPWRVAFALQADGWYLRSDIIWAKPNPMPESVTDRPTKSHEYLFLLAKSARYYFDADAVREANATLGDRREGNGRFAYDGKYDGQQDGTQQAFVTINPAGRNIRSVWTISTQPYPGAHFATFPEALVEPCVKAGTSERGVCPDCGAAWERQVRREGGERYATGKSATKNGAGLATAFSGYTDGSSAPTFTTTGWSPTCGHIAEPVPATVLDPFAGSGTTGRVANRLSRRAILIDLSADYLDQAMLRNHQKPLGLGA